MNEKHESRTPSLDEIRQHWGLAVDVHRREERLAEFDRAMVNNQINGITNRQGIALTILSAAVAKAGISGDHQALDHALDAFNLYIDKLVLP